MPKQVRPAPDIPDMEIFRQIGGGSYGEIWMARSITDTFRAVKVVYRSDFDDDRTFEREFEGILKYEPVARQYPALVDVLHVGRGENEGVEFYYYVMELGDDVERGPEIRPADYEPRTLRSDMMRGGRQPLEVVFCAEVGARLAGALAHLHEQGLAHRDVKPSNVIFVEGQACLADIGLVAARDQRTFVGTEGFVPPEGPGSSDADVYALGKVLYEMATGRDRLEFPELPGEPVHKAESKRWLALNKVICEVCDPRLKKRGYREAVELKRVLSSLAQAKRLKRKRRPIILASTSLIISIASLIPVFMDKPTRGFLEGERADLPSEAQLTVVSKPEGADLFDEDGIYLGITPFGPFELPYGEERNFVLTSPGYEDLEVRYLPEKAGDVLVVALTRYPLTEGFEWRDFQANRFLPTSQGEHAGAYLVGPAQFQASPIAAEGEWRVADVPQGGDKRRAVFVKPEKAEAYVDWLENKSEEEGVSLSLFHFSPLFGKREDWPETSADAWKDGLVPFRVLIKPVPQVHLVLDSEPTGAFVYLDGEFIGETPLEDYEVLPGTYQLQLGLDGFEDFQEEIVVKAKGGQVFPLVKLEPTKGMPWQMVEWRNSIGMQFVEFDEELLVSKWETRVRDYRAFSRAKKRAMLVLPDFPQDRNHPVVNVAREDGEAFCEWLTEKERREGRIRDWHQYRLPSDEEWSAFAGIEFEPPGSPQERASNAEEGYPWGSELPPVKRVANISGSERDGFLFERGFVEGYRDGFVYTAPVGSFKPNVLGICDLGGNVREWVSDPYSDQIPDFGTTRGGSWEDYLPDNLRTSSRRPVLDTSEAYGFRVVLSKLEQGDET